MPSYQDKQISPYSPQQLFALVADVPRYPEFLPWCRAARIIARESEQVFYAELVIAYKHFREQYTSRVELVPAVQADAESVIHVRMTEGPFHHLTNEWRFIPMQDGTHIEFTLDFAFRSKLLDALLGKFFGAAAGKMGEAFKNRADALYGKQH